GCSKGFWFSTYEEHRTRIFRIFEDHQLRRDTGEDCSQNLTDKPYEETRMYKKGMKDDTNKI
ncbi:hypothetical protein QCH68_28945, partial [Bacillus cereus]